jgi:hypothetical protein
MERKDQTFDIYWKSQPRQKGKYWDVANVTVSQDGTPFYNDLQSKLGLTTELLKQQSPFI